MLELVNETLRDLHHTVLVALLRLPLWACVLIYGYVLFSVLRFVSRFSFINVVRTIEPQQSISFPSARGTVTFAELVRRMPEFRTGAWAVMNPLLCHGHLQTMFAGLRSFRFADRLYFGRETLYLPDGAQVSLDRVIPKAQFAKEAAADGQLPDFTRRLTAAELQEFANSSKPIFLVLHGLSGSSSESYIRCLFARMPDFECMVLNSRGCGKTPLTTPVLFNGFWTYDLKHTVLRLRMAFPKRPIYAAGFSLGGSILANYVGQTGEESGLDLAVVVANPWDLNHSSFVFEKDFISDKIYSPIMTVPLKQMIKSHYKKLSENPDFEPIYKEHFRHVNSIKSFDNAFTSRLFGFNCASEYYRSGSSITRVFNIRTPTLVLTALDDPIVGGDEQALPLKETTLQPYLVTVCTTLGGHLGWFRWNNERWYARPLSRFLIEFHAAQLGKPCVDARFLPVKKRVVNDTLL
ncbi:hypothetical protein KL936_000402 [Ogataea polymorpha]|nr:hypothetical protein KL936_000402 [Ogataea polymorpha]